MKIMKYKTLLLRDGRIKLVNDGSICDRLIDKCMNTANKVYSFATDFLKINKESEEYVYMLCLNGRLELTSLFEVSHGTVNCSVITSREIFQKALLANAVYIILLHNHPSGNPVPSNNDIAITKQIKEAGHIMNVELVDHVIIGMGKYISLSDMEYI